MKRLFCFFLSLILILSVFCTSVFAISDVTPSENYTGAVETAGMPIGTPIVDGNIASGEGWGDAIAVDDTNCIPTLSSEFVFSCPSADVRYAFDNNNLYISADIIDDDFIYCTGVNEDVIYDSFYSGFSDKDFVGFNGDVFAFSLDQCNDMITVAGRCLETSDISAWMCFGLFEDGHIGVRRTLYDPEDMTGRWMPPAPVLTTDGALKHLYRGMSLLKTLIYQAFR